MNNHALRPSSPLSFVPAQHWQPARPSAALLHSAQASQFREMAQAFRDSGGIASSDDVVALLLSHTDQPISQLAHWIVDHDVLSFQWQLRTLVPLFQFDLRTMRLRPCVSAVIRELAPALSDWEISLWFATPNAWLSDAAPLDTMARDVPAVLDAARGERYLSRG